MESPKRQSLRAEQAAATRSRIVDAVVALVVERTNADFSMPDVARASGVSLRTVYRYFPTRQHVVDAVAAVGDHVAATNLPAAEFTVTDLRRWLEEAWRALVQQEAFIRAQHTSPNGAEIRRARIPFFREVTTVLLEREVPDLDPAVQRDVVDTILLLVSSSSMFELLDVLELDLNHAAKLASDAALAVIEANRNKTRPLDRASRARAETARRPPAPGGGV
jgi:AcrR family transcriptional regulator